MKISKQEVLHVAKLSRLDLSDKDAEKLVRQIGDILDYVDTLNSVDTTGVHATSHAIFVNNAFREDKAMPSMEPDKALGNAPEREDTDIIVPKVI